MQVEKRIKAGWNRVVDAGRTEAKPPDRTLATKQYAAPVIELRPSFGNQTQGDGLNKDTIE